MFLNLLIYSSSYSTLFTQITKEKKMFKQICLIGVFIYGFDRFFFSHPTSLGLVCSLHFLKIHFYFSHLHYLDVWPWTTKPVLSHWGIFVAIAKNTLYGSKLSIHIFLLVVCIAKNFIWTVLKAIFRFFCTLRFRFSNSCISAKYCPILTNPTSMESLFIQLSYAVYISISKDWHLWMVLGSRVTFVNMLSVLFS